MSLPAIAIEPSYFAFDQRDFKNGEELERRILLLTSARRLIAENAAIAILTSDETDAELVRTNYYPYHDRLENLLRRCGLGSAYSANDIRVIVQDVIGRSESLEEYVGVAFAFYDSDANTTPDCTPCYADAGLLSVFVQVLGIISAGMIRNSAIRDTLRLSCPPSKFYSSVQFSGTLLATDPDFGIQGEVVENIVLSDEYKSFIAGLDGLKLWRTAEDAQGFFYFPYLSEWQRRAPRPECLRSYQTFRCLQLGLSLLIAWQEIRQWVRVDFLGRPMKPRCLWFAGMPGKQCGGLDLVREIKLRARMVH